MIRSTIATPLRTPMRVLACFGAAALLSLGCASGGGGDGSTEGAAQATRSTKPISGKLAQVQPGMSEADVRNLLGEPASANAYPTYKRFMPYYYGSDTSRTDWVYPGLGKVVFSRNRYSGGLKVVEVLPE